MNERFIFSKIGTKASNIRKAKFRELCGSALTLISASRASAVINMDLKYFTKHPNVYVFCLQTHKNLQGKKGKGSPPRDYSKHLCLSQFLPRKLSFIGSVYFG